MIQVYDPPLCCSTGVCGPSVDPALTQFAADLEWLRRQGVAVERFNLAQDPGAFANHPAVKEELAREGTAALPLVLVDGELISRAGYPSRAALAGAAGVSAEGIQRGALLPIAGSGCCGPDGCC
jgi:hypothetical protein